MASHILNTSFIPTTPSLRRHGHGSTNTSLPNSIATTSRRTKKTQIQAKIREIFMPAMSSIMTEGKIVSWVKSEGDMDVETFYDGYLAAIMVEEGGVVPVGSAIALLAESEDEISLAKEKPSLPPEQVPILPLLQCRVIPRIKRANKMWV